MSVPAATAQNAQFYQAALQQHQIALQQHQAALQQQSGEQPDAQTVAQLPQLDE
ncbi:hypothetical protein AURDEDRAFT_178635, partial [Auricularia subglabra TFB-10046 SS5]